MKQKIGFIGTGNMGKAIINGLLQSKLKSQGEIVAYDAHQPTLEEVTEATGIQMATSVGEVVRKADILILAVKPHYITDVLKCMASDLKPDTIIVSIAAGVDLAKLSDAVPRETKIVRVMPNTPAMVGAGMSALSPNQCLSETEKEAVLSIFKSFGDAEIVDESLMDAVVGVSGSAPAYVYMFIEALADGAVMAGLPRKSAYKFAAQTVLGSAKMVLETGIHPGALKDMVTSPAGTTIEAVRSLEKDGFRSAVMNAVIAAAEKNKNM